jgi:hypothetical protein
MSEMIFHQMEGNQEKVNVGNRSFGFVDGGACLVHCQSGAIWAFWAGIELLLNHRLLIPRKPCTAMRPGKAVS